jgi:hypothetical protein
MSVSGGSCRRPSFLLARPLEGFLRVEYFDEGLRIARRTSGISKDVD